jgi:hypothetical protein
VIDATLMVDDSEAMAMAPGSIPTVIATKAAGVLVSQGEVSQPPSVDQMLLDLKRKIAEAEENMSPDATVEGSVEPPMLSLSALSAMSPSPGSKADKYQPATQYTPRPSTNQRRSTHHVQVGRWTKTARRRDPHRVLIQRKSRVPCLPVLMSR